MQADDITPLFGRTANDAAVEAFLTGAGITARPKLPHREYTAYVSAKQLGLSLVFQDEAMLRELDKPVGKSPLILIGAYFYSAGHDGYTQFPGALPGDIGFGDTRAQVAAKLGPPEAGDEEDDEPSESDEWLRDDCQVIVDYDEDSGKVVLVYCGYLG